MFQRSGSKPSGQGFSHHVNIPAGRLDKIIPTRIFFFFLKIPKKFQKIPYILLNKNVSWGGKLGQSETCLKNLFSYFFT